MVIAFNEANYSLEPSDFRCVRCEGEVLVESPFYSAICFEGEIFRRKSFCSKCWPETSETDSSFFAFWRSRRLAPEAGVRRVTFDPDLVLEFFRRLKPKGDLTDGNSNMQPEEKSRLRLVLALLLLRRKYLVYESSASRDGQEWLKLSEKGDRERTYLVENPPLSDAQLESVKVSLGDLLQMEI